MFVVNRAQIRRGDCASVKKQLKAKMCSSSVNIFCDIFLIFWCSLYFQGPFTAAIYLTEKVWILCWVSV